MPRDDGSLHSYYDLAVEAGLSGQLMGEGGYHMLECAQCRAHLTLDTLEECPICHSSDLIPDVVPRPHNSPGFNLVWGIFGCEDCGAVYSLDEDRTECPQCGSTHDLADRHVEKRTAYFGADLQRLQERLEFAHNLLFTDRGMRMPEAVYRDWLNPEVLEMFLSWADLFIHGMSEGDYNDPDRPVTQAGWTDLQAIINEVIDFALSLKRKPGPPGLIATHRTLTRGALQFASACVEFVTTLTAPTASVARQRMARGQDLLDVSGEVVARASQLSGPESDDDDLMLSGKAASTVFTELSRIAASDPVLLRPLIPFVRLSRQMLDPDRRVQHVDLIVSTLDSPGDSDAWVQSSDEFHVRCSSGWRKLVSQHERLVRVLNDDRVRTGWVDEVLDIAMKLVEGPYRLYGGIIAVANRVAAGLDLVFDEAVSERHRGFSTVLKGLAKVDPLFVEGVDRLVRNAAAHYDYGVSGEVIEIRHLPPGPNALPQVDRLSFDDLLALVSNLLEHCLAMAIGILRWVWQSGSIDMRERFRQDWLTA